VETIKQSEAEDSFQISKRSDDYWLQKEAEYLIESDRQAREREKNEEAKIQAEYDQYAKFLLAEERERLNDRRIEERFENGDLSLTPKIDRDLKGWNIGY
jgi:hypothetical protein